MIAPASRTAARENVRQSVYHAPVFSDSGEPDDPGMIRRAVANHPTTTLVSAIFVGLSLGWFIKRKLR